MKPGRSFSTRLVLAVTLVAATVVSAGLYLDYRIARARIVDDLSTNARLAISSATDRLEEMATGVESAVRTVGDALAVIPDAEATDRLLTSLIASNPHIAASALAFTPEVSGRADGFAPYRYRRPGSRAGAIDRADLADAPKPFWSEAWFEQPRARGAALWIEPYFEATGLRTTMITFAAPLYRAGGAEPDFFGVITADVTLASLEPYLDSLALENKGFGFLLSRQGTLIGAPAGEVVGQAISSVFPGVPSLNADTWRTSANTPGFVESVPCLRRKGRCSLRLTPMSVAGWSIGIVYSEEELLRPLRTYALRTSMVGVLMLTLIAFLIGALAQRLTRPLKDLAAASAAIATGNLRIHLPEARGDDEIATLVRAFDTMRIDLATHIEKVAQAAAASSRVEAEMAAAAQIQRAMVPQGGLAELSEERLELWARLQPARAVGGDLYSFRRDADRLLFAIGDVSDKGVAAALFMARTIALIAHWESHGAPVPPHRALREINDSLCVDNDGCMFVTLTLGILELPSHRLSFASAGHLAPLLVRERAVSELSQDRGPPLALQEGLDFPLNEITLRADDRLVFFTDGFDEARNSSGDALGMDALMALVAEGRDLPAAEAASRLFAAAEDFAAGAAQHDDMTLLQLAIPGDPDRPLQSDHRAFALDAGLVGATWAWAEDCGRRQGLAEHRFGDLRLALEELVCNIRDHGGLRPDETITLHMERFGDRVELCSEDTGRAFNPLAANPGAELGLEISDAAIGGLGVHLIKRLTDARFYRREKDRNILRLRFDLAETEQPDAIEKREILAGDEK